MSDASDDKYQQPERDRAMDMRGPSALHTPSSSQPLSTQRAVRFDTGNQAGVGYQDEMASGLTIDMDTFDPLANFNSRQSRQSPANSILSHPDTTHFKASSTAPSSIKSRNVRQDKHGVMAKCENITQNTSFEN